MVGRLKEHGLDLRLGVGVKEFDKMPLNAESYAKETYACAGREIWPICEGIRVGVK